MNFVFVENFRANHGQLGTYAKYWSPVASKNTVAHMYDWVCKQTKL